MEQSKCKLSASHSVMSNSLRPHGLQPTRLLCPWDFPGKDTGVGCHFLLHMEQRGRINSCRSWDSRGVWEPADGWQAIVAEETAGKIKKGAKTLEKMEVIQVNHSSGTSCVLELGKTAYLGANLKKSQRFAWDNA